MDNSTLNNLTSHMTIVRNLSNTIQRDTSLNLGRTNSNIFDITRCIDQKVQRVTTEVLEMKYTHSQSLVVT